MCFVAQFEILQDQKSHTEMLKEEQQATGWTPQTSQLGNQYSTLDILFQLCRLICGDIQFAVPWLSCVIMQNNTLSLLIAVNDTIEKHQGKQNIENEVA